LAVRYVAGQLGHQAAHDRHKSHQDGKHDSWQETSDDTENNLGDVENPFKPSETIGQVVDVGNETDKGNCIR
jgi:hypothetical protein